MSRVLKFTVITVGIVIALLVIAVVAAAIFFPGEKVRSLVEREASKALGMPVTIGSAKLSVIGMPAVRINDINAGDASGSEPALLSVSSVAVRINIVKLLRREIEISSILIDEPVLTLLTHEDGSTNLPASKEGKPELPDADESAPKLPFPVSLKAFRVDGGRVTLDNRDSGSLILVEKITVDTGFTLNRDLTDFRSTGRAEAGSIVAALTRDKPLEPAKASFAYTAGGNPSTGDFKLTDGVFELNGLEIPVSGQVTAWKKTSFRTGVENLPIADVLAAIPDGAVPEQDKLSANGTVTVTVDGTMDSESAEPALTYNGLIYIDIPHLAFEGLPNSLENITGRIGFTEKELAIESFGFRAGASNVSVSGTIADYAEKPVVALSAKGDIDLTDIAGAVPMPEGYEAGGTLDFDVSLKGDPAAPATFAASGGANLNSVTVIMPDFLRHPATVDGRLSVTPMALTINNLGYSSGVSDGTLTGEITNYMALAGIGDGGAHVTGAFRAKYLDVDDLLLTRKELGREPMSLKPWEYEQSLTHMPVPPTLSAAFSVAIDGAKFGKIETGSIIGRCTLDKGILDLAGLTVKAYQGTIAGVSTVDFSNPENVTYSGDFKLQGLDSASFITDFLGAGDFVRGKLSSSLQFSGAGLDSVAMLDNLRAGGDMRFDNGEIVNFGLAKEIGGSLKFLAFDTLPFASVVNSFSVEDRKFITPDMAIKTQYGDFIVDGFTGFDTALSYDITFNLNRETSKKALNSLSTLTQYMNSTPERLELNITAGGTLSKPTVKVDTSQAEALLKESLKDEAVKKIDEFLDSPGNEELKEKGKQLLDSILKKK